MKENWQYKKLGEVCVILDSKRKPITKSQRIPGSIPYYGASGVQDYVRDFIFEGRFLLIGEDGAKWGPNEKSSYIIEGKSWVNNHVHILKMKDNIIDIYAQYYLNKSDLNHYITGAVVPKLTQTSLVNILIPVPPLEEQERIVGELDLLSGIIEKQKQQLKELDILAQSIFYSMFGDPVTNDKNWPLKNLGEVCKLSAGGDKPTDTTKEQSVKNPIPVYSNGIENEGLYGFTSTPKIVEPSLTISGRGTIGVPFIRKYPFVPIIRLIVATPFEKLNLHFLYYIIKLLKLNGNGGAIPQLTVPMIKDLKCILPPISLQNEFAEKIERIEKQKEAVNQSIEETQKLFDYTMDKYFG